MWGLQFLHILVNTCFSRFLCCSIIATGGLWSSALIGHLFCSPPVASNFFWLLLYFLPVHFLNLRHDLPSTFPNPDLTHAPSIRRTIALTYVGLPSLEVNSTRRSATLSPTGTDRFLKMVTAVFLDPWALLEQEVKSIPLLLQLGGIAGLLWITGCHTSDALWQGHKRSYSFCLLPFFLEISPRNPVTTLWGSPGHKEKPHAHVLVKSSS